jgi:DNA-binding response OmpR family regulator
VSHALSHAGLRGRFVEDPTLAVQTVRQRPLRAALVDLAADSGDPLALCQQVRFFTEAPIVAVEGTNGKAQGAQALEAAADNCIARPVDRQLLAAVLKAALRRAELPTIRDNHDPLVVADVRLERRSRLVTVSGRARHLSPKEFALLELLMQRVDQVLSKEVIMQRVWAAPPGTDDRTVAVHIARIRRKICDHHRRQKLVHTVPGIGYMMRTPVRSSDNGNSNGTHG